jgi:hypothetical protein
MASIFSWPVIWYDENQMRAVALAQSLEWAMENEDSAAQLKVVQDVAARPGVVA